MRRHQWTVAAALLACAVVPVAAQSFPTADPVLERIWRLSMDSTQVEALAQTLLDSVGPRLTGTPGQRAAHDWAVRQYEGWGIAARNEQYGTWRGWRRGVTHIDLLEPRVRSLEGTMLAWSPGTAGADVEAGVLVLPQVANAGELDAWLRQARGKYVLVSYAQESCRPLREWEEYGVEGAAERHRDAQRAAAQAWNERISAAAGNMNALRLRLDSAGVAGIVQSNWSNDYGVNKIFGTNTTTAPTLDLSCEDYGLVFRLAENGQGPVLRVRADAEFLGDVPTFNTIAEIRGTEKPDEYVLLSAHFDSWEGSSGATDNGTGTVVMMEAMRILKRVYPNPKRTILVGHWSGEEQGLNGSRAFAADHPEVVDGLHALFNQDNGTGRVVNISMQGLTGAGEYFARWLSQVPPEITTHIDLNMPGTPGGGGSDYASFICAGAPAFGLSSLNWGYFTYTWHTNRDTFDKIVFEDVKNNVALVAMLTYLASEEPARVPRERRVLPLNREGEQMSWPQCRDGQRTTP